MKQAIYIPRKDDQEVIAEYKASFDEYSPNELEESTSGKDDSYRWVNNLLNGIMVNRKNEI